MLHFTLFVAQLALLLAAFKVYDLEVPTFFKLCEIVFAGFAVSYWVPFRFKEFFLIAISLGGACLLLTPLVASLLLGVGAALFAIVSSPVAFRWKVVVLLCVLAVAVYGKSTGAFPVPHEFWPVLGSVFMFRMIVYMYDLSHAKAPPPLKDFATYFFILPNYYFLLFPIVDFQTMRKSYFKRDINVVAQQGVWWIVRGATHLLLYRIIYQTQGTFTPPTVSVPIAVVGRMLFTYLLILRVTGQFHIIAGMLCLFGYDVPEMNHLFLLSAGFNDFWRRASIYWKDFMVKVFYYPAYFAMRKANEHRAQIVATAWVFVVTWFLHGVQFYWIQGRFPLTWNDALFWFILGSFVVGEAWYDMLHPRPARALTKTGWKYRAQHAAKVGLTIATVSVLFSLWSANSMEEWFYFLRSGHV